MAMLSEMIFPGPLAQRSFRRVIVLDSPFFFGAHEASDYDPAYGKSWSTVPLGA